MLKYILLLKKMFFENKFFQGDIRTVKAKKNILISFIIKGVSIVSGFFMVRLSLDYLDSERYGIWLTLSSFLTWFSFFEIGLGSGLRNKLAEALAVKDYKLGKIYVSTTYAILTIVILIVAVLFFLGNNYIDWPVLLNTNKNMAQELSSLSLIVFCFFFLQFIFQLIGVILFADQRPALANSLSPIGNFLALIVIYIFTKTTQGSLLFLGWSLSLAPVIVLIVASFYFYKKEYSKIAPSIMFVDFKYAKELLSLGLQFFIIQISALVLFQSSNIIIAQYFGPKEVTSYNIAYKFFSIINMLFSLIMIPYWSAFTEAWVKLDIAWIDKTIKGLIKIFLAFTIVGIILLFIADWVFVVWIGEEKMKNISINFLLKISLILNFLVFSFGGIFNMFINGTGKIRLQMISLFLGAIIFVPVTIGMIKYLHLGVASVVIGTILANFYSPFIAPIQYYKLIKDKAYGIWNK